MTKKIIAFLFLLNISIYPNEKLKILIQDDKILPTNFTINVVLNSENFRENLLELYFKIDKERNFNDIWMKVENTKEYFENDFKKENLEFHYLSGGIKLRNGEIFKYGKISYAGMSYTFGNEEKRLRLELFFLDKNNNLITKLYEPILTVETENKLYNLIEKVNNSKQEGVYMVNPVIEEISMITQKKKIYQEVSYLTVERRELYEFLLELFKNKIPKEFFEARKNNKYFKKLDWNNCDNCIKN